jgi:c-di-GMP-binding flagellar brake protein YcgR
MKERYVERRTHKRYAVEGIRGNVHCLSDLKVIHISIDGAAIETTNRLEVNREYRFRIDYKDTPLNLNGFVTWSKLTRSEKRRSGESVPIYKAGVKFIGIMDKKAETLMSFIEENKVRTPERRSGVRYKISTSENIKIAYPYGCDVKKISLAGMEIETEHPLVPDSTHNMEFWLNEGAVHTAGRIVTCVEIPLENRTKYNMGVEFIKISDADSELLRNFLDTLEKS